MTATETMRAALAATTTERELDMDATLATGAPVFRTVCTVPYAHQQAVCAAVRGLAGPDWVRSDSLRALFPSESRVTAERLESALERWA